MADEHLVAGSCQVFRETRIIFASMQPMRCRSGPRQVPVNPIPSAMRVIQPLAFLGIGLLALGNRCEPEPAAPAEPLATGRLVRLESTVNDRGQRPRPRWEVDVAPLAFPGLTTGGAPGQDYTQAKVFDLPDTATYRVGCSIRFRYHLVPPEQHTPWRTYYERMNTAPGMAWGDRLPELTLTQVELVPPQ